MRTLILAVAVMLAGAMPAWAQGADADARWNARITAVLKQADDREACLIRRFDAERGQILARIARVSRDKQVSEDALAAALAVSDIPVRCAV